jgi:MurNAc alpha-1-phosphate uridylyltransferase
MRSAPSITPLKALVLAAGRGERMRPLTDHRPKPLLPVGGRPMIEWHLLALAAAGVQEVVINTAWLEDQFRTTLGDGSRFGLRLHYSMEGRDHGGALETAGGIAKALPLLGDCFWLVSGDIVAPGFRFDATAAQRFAAGSDDAHLWLVPNPDFHSAGDFALGDTGRLQRPPAGQPRPWTYANLALVRRTLVDGVQAGERAALGPLLFASAHAGRLGGEVLHGPWHNVGTPAQLAAAGLDLAGSAAAAAADAGASAASAATIGASAGTAAGSITGSAA